MSLFALAAFLACDSDEDFAGPTDQWEGLIAEEESEDDFAAQDGEIDTGDWEDPPQEAPPDDGARDDDPQEEPPLCSEADLLFVAEIVRADGSVLTAPTPEDELFFVGRAVNPCDDQVGLTTTSHCLVQRWEVKDASGTTVPIRPECEEGSQTWDLDPGDEVFQTSQSRRFGPGDYTLTVRFDAEPYLARQDFTIQ